ncbi:hypothetical protein AMS68_007790 [Peltaster fructicola]|uniref:alpha-1,2-Mannosidase n=1 Tax=Peltaster fructicola TaxID=286661 RepID=A0A6H0Y5J6_9PEZI|nr:hypothetical protein AMS68_007790 [Peltaster fructicola]
MSIKTRGSSSIYLILSIFCLLLLLHLRANNDPDEQLYELMPETEDDGAAKFDWAARVPMYPVTSFVPVPKGTGGLLRVQHKFTKETMEAERLRVERQAAIKDAFVRCWTSYREHAWLEDELMPISGSSKSPFGGWAATLVDSLDTLWIMDLKEEFAEAVEAAIAIDFTNTTSHRISLFETNIRYLGGLLSAHDLSGDRRLLRKALEIAHVLYAAFDTPDRMPINWWSPHGAAAGSKQIADPSILSAEIGSLSLEFTRLSQLTGDPMWHDAIHRIMTIFAKQQYASFIPGMWPLGVNPQTLDFATGTSFTLGAMADSLYEYLPKMHALLGGSGMYERMYADSMDAAIRYSFFRPMLPDNADVLVAGSVSAQMQGQVLLEAKGEHLACFVGGMLALGGRLTGNESHVELGRKVTDGCIWTYEHSAAGIMPEAFLMVACSSWSDCEWDVEDWYKGIKKDSASSQDAELIATVQRLPPGFTAINDRRYLLRPEAIESVFINYRVGGDPDLMDKGWAMWQSIDKHTRTEYANAALHDVTDPKAPKSDSMESFWTAETLKYFYLLYSPPNLISLDEFVFNTEAHPFRRPKQGWW